MKKLLQGFTRIPNMIIFDADLSPLALRVFVVLSMYADNETKKCFPMLHSLCTVTGRGKARILAALKELIEKEYISITKQGRRNYYDLSPAWKSWTDEIKVNESILNDKIYNNVAD